MSKSPWSTMSKGADTPDGNIAGAYVPAPPDGPMDKLGDWMYHFPDKNTPEQGESNMKQDETVMEWISRMLLGDY